MAKRSIVVCDGCGEEVPSGTGAKTRTTFVDEKRGAKEADVCDKCADTIPGRASARRGRKPTKKSS